MADDGDTRWLLIGRVDGKSASRRQRRFATEDKARAAVVRWRRDGFNTWWLMGPGDEREQWIDS